ncbi:MAG: hypothetical protein LH629_03305 [Ignavibacteria bacterium]|nr:hypothetical protein [Ignavibacteria bacterium]
MEELKDVIKNINPNKAVGWDLINPSSFKEIYWRSGISEENNLSVETR